MQIRRTHVAEIDTESPEFVQKIVSEVNDHGYALITPDKIPDNMARALSELGKIFGNPKSQKLSDETGIHPIRYIPGNPEYANANCGDLALHTDASFEPSPPLYMLMACEQPSSSGGMSVLATGDELLQFIRATDPTCFDGLCRPDSFRISRDGVESSRAVFSEIDGRLRLAFRYAPDLKMSVHNEAKVGFDLIKEWVNRPESSQEVCLDRGDFLIFDNARILHGRTAFPPDAGRSIYGLWCDGQNAHPELRSGIPQSVSA